MKIKKSRPKPPPVPEANQLLIFAETETASAHSRSDVKTLTTYEVLCRIASNQGINSPKLAAFFRKTMKTVARFTTELRYRDFIEFRGSLNKGGYFLKPAGLEFLKNPEADSAFSPQRMTAERVEEFIRNNPGANHYAIAAHFHRTVKSATRHTAHLRQKEKIVFRGTPRDGGFYSTT